MLLFIAFILALVYDVPGVAVLIFCHWLLS